MRQIIQGRWAGNLEFASGGITAVDTYGVIGSSVRFTGASGSNHFTVWPMSADGQLENITMHLRATPASCGVTSFTWVLRKNGGDTAAVLVFGATETSATYTGTPIPFVAGDQFQWRCRPDPIFPIIISMFFPDVVQTVEYVGTETGVSLYYSRGVGILPGSADGFSGVFNGQDDFIGDDNSSQNVISVAGTLTRYDILMERSPIAAGGTSVTFLYRIDDIDQDGSGGTVDTRVTLTSTATATWTGLLPIDPATQDRICLKSIPVGFGAGGGSTRTSFCHKFVATTDGEFWVGGFNGVPPSNSQVVYQVPTANDINHSWETTELAKDINTALTTYELSGLRVWLANEPGATRSRTFAALYDGAFVGGYPTVTIAGVSHIEDGTGSVTHESGHTWNFRQTPTNAPTSLVDGIAWAFVGRVDIIPPPTPSSPYQRRWLRRAPHIVDSGTDEWIYHKSFELWAEAGVGIADGQGVDPQVMFRWSNDGAHTWGQEIWRSMGPMGQFARRMRWLRLGNARDRVYEVSGSDPVKIALIGAVVDVEKGQS